MISQWYCTRLAGLIVLGALLYGRDAPANSDERPAEPPLKVGATAIEFQIDTSMPMAGMIGPRWAMGQDGPLRAVATVIQGPPDNTRIAIVALDVWASSRALLDAAARQVERETGIAFDHILIHATHTHYAPSTVKKGFGHDFEVLEFSERVKAAIVQAVVHAHDRLAQAPLATTSFAIGPGGDRRGEQPMGAARRHDHLAGG